MAEVVIRLTDGKKKGKVNIEFEFFPPLESLYGDDEQTSAQGLASVINDYIMAQNQK